MADHSNYQKKVIQRYYDHREQGDQQRLAELVTNLYLTETPKKRAKLWEQARETMVRLNVPTKRIDHVIQSADAAILAVVVQELEAGTLRPEK